MNRIYLVLITLLLILRVGSFEHIEVMTPLEVLNYVADRDGLIVDINLPPRDWAIVTRTQGDDFVLKPDFLGNMMKRDSSNSDFMRTGRIELKDAIIVLQVTSSVL